MTFKEILQRNAFESIIPFLRKDDNDMRVTNIRVYKETYDEICRQPDATDNQNITVVMETGDKGGTHIMAYGLDVETLESNANKNVIADLPDGYDEADVCATLLRQIAHYGYTTRVKKRYLEERSNPLVKMQRTLYLKSCAHYLPKHLRKELNHTRKMTTELRMVCYKREAKKTEQRKCGIIG